MLTTVCREVADMTWCYGRQSWHVIKLNLILPAKTLEKYAYQIEKHYWSMYIKIPIISFYKEWKQVKQWTFHRCPFKKYWLNIDEILLHATLSYLFNLDIHLPYYVAWFCIWHMRRKINFPVLQHFLVHIFNM